MADDEKKPAADYEVGYGKPPKHTQFGAEPARRARGSKRSRTQIDIAAILRKLVPVKKDGAEVNMLPFEIGLRAQVKKALKEKNLAAIKILLDLAIEHGLVKPPPPSPMSGGIIVVPKTVTEEQWDAIDGANRTWLTDLMTFIDEYKKEHPDSEVGIRRVGK